MCMCGIHMDCMREIEEYRRAHTHAPHPIFAVFFSLCVVPFFSSVCALPTDEKMSRIYLHCVEFLCIHMYCVLFLKGASLFFHSFPSFYFLFCFVLFRYYCWLLQFLYCTTKIPVFCCVAVLFRQIPPHFHPPNRLCCCRRR